MAFIDWVWLLTAIVEILIITLVLYLCMRLICGRKRLSGNYFLRLVIVSVILVLGIVLIGWIISLLLAVSLYYSYFAAMFYVFLTVLFIVIVRSLLTTHEVVPGRAEKYWQWSIWVTVIALFLIFLINFLIVIISTALGNPIDLIPHF